MIDFLEKERYGLEDLARIVAILRAPGGCPWDGEQTHQSIRRNLLEEACEAAEAIDEGSPEHLKEELGDVLLQVVFHASIEQDAGRFDLNDVADGVCRKLIYRHPHVFGSVTVRSTGEVLSNWEELKRKEKGQVTQADAVDAVAKTLPALWRAEKVQKKAAKSGYDRYSPRRAVEELSACAGRLCAAAEAGSGGGEALGALLFAAVGAARALGLDPEDALHAACDGFSARFRAVEQAAAEAGGLDSLSGAEADKLWAGAGDGPKEA